MGVRSLHKHASLPSKGDAKDPSVASVAEICASSEIPGNAPISLWTFFTDFKQIPILSSIT